MTMGMQQKVNGNNTEGKKQEGRKGAKTCNSRPIKSWKELEKEKVAPVKET